MLDSKKPIVTINLTPLVDVSLVLVVIFMATAPMFLQSGIIVTSGTKQAAAEKQAAAPPEKSIVIKLHPDQLLLNQQPVTETDLPVLLRSLLANSQSRRVIVNPDREVVHGRVVRIMDIAKQAGADNLVILGKSQGGQEPNK
jgi:biopolymer transport protein ExbD